MHARRSPLTPRKFYDGGGESVAILNVDGELYAIRNTCPHMGGPVGAVVKEGHFDWGPVGVGRRGALLLRPSLPSRGETG